MTPGGGPFPRPRRPYPSHPSGAAAPSPPLRLPARGEGVGRRVRVVCG
ncbi:hypothetical protein STRIP9103_08503 [Streptomyces ipomoeae 91-03]|uniref:Uncharacterized protein n=1 Tax=Streptomyces ipomoeae 91-03 TaxID=698759 RepID=L1KUT6_9ACTN|nr:hypothetical protein STRIP9103_08503 [Streptomyces ipomoeae 91-03]